MREVKPPRHRCRLGDPWARHGQVVACDDCGKWWRAVEPGNPAYANWRRAWVRQLIWGRR
jgi:hypothetical protein